jgi:inositol polyphosphate 5-phosphatase INPP5B/F
MAQQANKGAVGTALNLFNGSVRLHFINSHLAAFDDYVEKRNADYQTVTRYLDFRADGLNSETHGVFDCDVLFWLVLLIYILKMHRH